MKWHPNTATDHDTKLARLAARLHVRIEGDIDAQHTVVFLHGIAANINTWQSVRDILGNAAVRQVYVDLLGFGDSPKPRHADYGVDTHAKAVWLSLDAQGITGKITLVGHSMGCIVATHMAVLRPSRVNELLLVSLPLYRGYEMIQSRRNLAAIDRLINQLYFKTYTYMREDSLLLMFIGSLVTRFAGGRIGFELGWRNLVAFRRSLVNSIAFQHTEAELRSLKGLPVFLYYGTLDPFVIKRYLTFLAASRPKTYTRRVLNASHAVLPALARPLAHDLRAFAKEKPT